VHVAEATGYLRKMQDGYRDGDPQSESVSAPKRVETPPRRGRIIPIVIAVLLLAGSRSLRHSSWRRSMRTESVTAEDRR
jgi:hypothetical protein